MPHFRFIVNDTRCMNCGICMDVCPFTCIEFTRADNVDFYGSLYKFHPLDFSREGDSKLWMMERPYLPIQERCTGCQVCVRECPTDAISVKPDPARASLKPKPVILKREPNVTDEFWQPMSKYTRDYLKRPVKSPWSEMADWKPMIKERKVSQTWKTMEPKE
jgi:ferredoxin